MAILSLVALVLMPTPRARIGGVELRAEAAQIAATFRKARAAAIRAGEPRDVLVDTIGRAVIFDGDMQLRLPDEIDMSWVTSSLCPMEAGQRALRFLPDGRSCGGVLTLASAGNAMRLRVDWLTGRVEMLAR